MSEPLGFATNVYGAQDILKAPAQLVSVVLNHTTLCETPYTCANEADAERLVIEAESFLSEKRDVLPASNLLGELRPYPPVITHYVNGYSRVSIKAYVVRRELPIGRSVKEAQTNPLGYWPLSMSNPVFEDRPLRLTSSLLKNRYQTERGFNTAFGTLELQGIVKRVMKEDFIRPKFRFLKAPRYTYDRDRTLIKQGQSRSLGSREVSLLPQERYDLFNPNIILVENEGDGRAMGQ